MAKYGFKIGDKVSVVNDDIKGVVVAFLGTKVTVHTEDGFDASYKASEIIHCADFLVSKVKNKDAKTISKKKISKKIKAHKQSVTEEIDLHLEKVPGGRNCPKEQALETQLNHAVCCIEMAIYEKKDALIFIHGVGEGVLKSELHKILRGYDCLSFGNAPLHLYGYGATEVVFSFL